MHPRINVNHRDFSGWTPFFSACLNGHTACASLLLADSRLDVNLADLCGTTPARTAAYYGHMDIIKAWITSERELSLGKSGDFHSDPISASKTHFPQIASLLTRCKENEMLTRHQMRLELGFKEKPAAQTFALVVLLADD